MVIANFTEPAESLSGSDRSVRPAIDSDASRIALLQRQALAALLGTDAAAQLPSLDAFTAQWQRSLVEPRPAGCHTVVALHGHQVVGFASCVPGEELTDLPGRDTAIPAGTEIHSLQVDPNFTRSGHASRMLQAIVDLARPENLRIWVNADGEELVRFLRSAGFAPAGLRRAFEVPDAPVITEHLWWAAI